MIQTPAPFVSQQQGSFPVTLTLQAPARNGRSFFDVVTTLPSPLTVDFRASLAVPGPQGDPVTPGSTSSGIFQSFEESVTFPAGVSTETVTVPIIASAPAANPSAIQLSATSPSASVQSMTFDLGLYSSQDAYPPQVISARLITQGQLATGIALTFDKPMAPATVENPGHYRVTSMPNIQVHSGLLGRLDLAPTSASVTIRSFPLGPGTYDPSTDTVTLPLRKPVKSSLPYAITAEKKAGHGITDAEGRPIDPHGGIAIGLQPLP
jgi:hypothetical protein